MVPVVVVVEPLVIVPLVASVVVDGGVVVCIVRGHVG